MVKRPNGIEKYGAGTALIMFAGIGFLAILDQLIIRDVEINPIVYTVMGGMGTGSAIIATRKK